MKPVCMMGAGRWYFLGRRELELPGSCRQYSCSLVVRSIQKEKINGTGDKEQPFEHLLGDTCQLQLSVGSTPASWKMRQGRECLQC